VEQDIYGVKRFEVFRRAKIVKTGQSTVLDKKYTSPAMT
jgi:hypothetical protein